MARVMTKALLLAMMMVMNIVAETKDVAESLTDLERKLAELTASLKKTNETHAQMRGQQELPTTCERGMGDDLTKTYPPYVIMSHDGPKKQILCDTHTDGGGWIVLQRRATGDVDFYRDWTSYREGFGSLTGDFWMGNEALFNLTDAYIVSVLSLDFLSTVVLNLALVVQRLIVYSNALLLRRHIETSHLSLDPYELRIDIRINNGQEVFARYPDFRIESESNKYRLHIGSYTGTAGDAMAYHNKIFFSTFDRDNDEYSGSCAVSHHAGWWYKTCAHAHLNYPWAVTETADPCWNDGKKSWRMSFIEMKMRRIKLI
ncbi:fibrinogen-related protein 3-2 [Plakobranchus ocellatus]|uniref:Fibrinogen-related protein 3-2 n=1 Tax=Plakobranchus ocellatus TaxID=259542 RepID=A0AAV4AFB0_9GAST|nr:fibrinogen-related protein 3-2 [Plakobranchus ocellatus]